MSLQKRGKVWWYEFWFAGLRIQDSSKSTSKTIAKQAEQKRRRELEEGFNGLEDGRAEQIRTIRELAKEYITSCALRNRGVVFAEYALRHVNAHIGDKMVVDVDADIGASGDDPFTVSGNNSNLADHTLMKVLNNGELIVAGGTGNGYRFAEIMGASNPSGWSGVIKVKTPAGVTAGYILLYSNP